MNDLPLTEELEKKQRMYRLSELFCLVALVFVLQILGETVISVLRYDRALIEAGQWWRIVSGNFVHLGSNHMLMNLSVFALASLLFRPNTNVFVWHGAILLLSFAVGFGLFIFDTHVSRYVGFSGVLYGVFAFGLFVSFKDNPWLYALGLLFVVYKVFMQQGPAYNPEDVRKFIGGNVIASAHLYGLIIGLVLGACHFIKNKSWNSLGKTRS